MRDAGWFEEVEEETALKQLKTMTRIVRNLSMHRSNEISMFKHAELFNRVLKLFTGLWTGKSQETYWKSYQA